MIGWAGCGASSVYLGPDGKILTVGRAHNGHVWTFALSRHHSDGSLDTSFDGDGILMTPFESYGSEPSEVLSQPDGKILAVGSGSEISTQTNDFALARYNPNGSRDTTFDADGKVTTNFADVFTGNRLYDVATGPGGKILASGSPAYSVIRYDPDGSRDTSFNGIGHVTAGSSGGPTHVAVTVQPDGKTIVAGMAYVGEMYDMALDIVRYNSDGTPDASFGDSGHVVFPATGGDWSDASWVHVQPDGKIIAGGGDRIFRLNPNGSLDTGFGGGDGIANVPLYAYACAVQPNGKIVIAGPRWNGSVSNSTHDLLVARLDPDGAHDPTFGSGGLATIPSIVGIGREIVGRTIAVQADGKIVAGGHRLVRLNQNGSLDAGFGNDGIVTPPMSFREVVIQPDGKLVIAGTSNNDFAVARYSTNGSLDTSFGDGDGVVTVDFNNSNDTAYGMTLDPEGRAVIVGESNGAFALARIMLRASISLSGRVTTPGGLGLRNAVVSLTDSLGVMRTATTSSFGLYSFGDVPVGGTYTITVASRRYRFTPRTLAVNNNLTNIDFVGLE